MYWYYKYLSVFEKPLSGNHREAASYIRNNIEKFESKEPLVSVVVIAHNEESRLLACLWSLVDNVCSCPVEIIGVDNNSTDNTGKLMQEAGIKYFYEEKKGPGYARNCGLFHAKGKYHLCIDADTIYPPFYIEKFTEELKKNGVVAAMSFWSFVPDANYSAFQLKVYEFLRDIHLRILFRSRPELCVRGMVFGFETEKGKEAGFKVNILRGEDGALANELKKSGNIKLITSRKARPVSAVGTLSADGSLFKSFKVRFIKALKGFKKYFVSQSEYKDQDSNLIK